VREVRLNSTEKRKAGHDRSGHHVKRILCYKTQRSSDDGSLNVGLINKFECYKSYFTAKNACTKLRLVIVGAGNDSVFYSTCQKASKCSLIT
jgi:hypothetical protein